jgi:tetratricopeptide (TPR) repeat protein
VPVIDLLKAYFQIESRDDGRRIREKVSGKLLTLARWHALDPPQRRQRTLDSVRHLLLRESQVQPLLLVLEDLHWIDSETQAFLDSLVESLPTARLLLLVNYRPEYQHGWGGKTAYTQCRIDPLPPDNAAELLRAVLGDDPSLAPLTRLLIERTEGNPFFLEESTRTLVETQALLGERGAYRLARPLPSVEVPVTVQTILAARIDRLPVEEKSLLQSASVIGKDVPFPLLQAVVALPEETLRRHLAHLQAGEFLYEIRLFPDIERLYPDRLTEQVERLAHHASRAEVWDKALRYMRQAGHKAASRSAHREAVACFDQALAALAHLPEDREALEQAIDLRFELRTSLFPLAELSRILAVLDEAARMADAVADRRRLGQALALIGNYHYETGRSKSAIEYAERALAIARDPGDPELEGGVTFLLGQIHYGLGNYVRAIDLLVQNVAALDRQPLSTYPVGPARLPVTARCFLARALAEVGEFRRAAMRAEEAITLCEGSDEAFGLAHGCYALGLTHLRQGDLVRAISVLERGLGVARARAVSFLLPILGHVLGYAQALVGRIQEGLALLEQASDEARSTGRTRVVVWAQEMLAQVYLACGREGDAAVTARDALDASRRIGVRGGEARVLRTLGDIAARGAAPDFDQARCYYQEALDLAEEIRMRPLVAHCHLGLGKLSRRTGKPEQAREHLTTATAMYREMEMTYWLAQAERGMKELS